MLTEKAVMSNDVGSPITTGVTFVANQNLIQVPVHLDSSNNVFAPPFLIPGGKWTVTFMIEDPGMIFESITFNNGPTRVITNNPPQSGETTWTTSFDTAGVLSINMLDCTINLQQVSTGKPFSGDPTIAVTSDPITG